MKRIGVDVGGTFTDVVLLDTVQGSVVTAKVPSTPSNPADGIMAGIREILARAACSLDAVDVIGHGSTVVTNTLLEENGAPTGLITTRGFRDLLELRRSYRHDRADLYDIHFRNPAPLVPRCRRLEVSERLLADGTEASPLDLAEVAAVVDQLRAQGVTAVAVCFLYSFHHPEHEVRTVEFLAAHAPDLYVSVSSVVDPQIGEYERTSTTVTNAYVGPRAASYVSDLSRRLSQADGRVELRLMQSNGGLVSAGAVLPKPITLVNSGPAGGVTAAAFIASQAGYRNVITADMGGTSFDVSVIQDGAPRYATQMLVNKRHLRVPTIDIFSVGAGGGSVAWLDSGGALRVGPRSAGAVPGPACYGLGGEEPTVTDANVVLGYIDPAYFVGGRMALRPDLAESAVRTRIAEPLGLGVEQAAESIRRIVNNEMSQAIRVNTIERGHDPRDFILFAFGGAGALHAAELARELSIPRVLVPPHPGVASAFGMVVADVVRDYQAPVLQRVAEVDLETIDEKLDRLVLGARADMAREGFSEDRITIQVDLEVRYYRQLTTLRVAVSGTRLEAETLENLRERFEQEHRKMYRYTLPWQPIELVNLRVRATGVVDKFMPPLLFAGERPRVKGSRRVFLDGKSVVVPVIDRSLVRPGERVAGPCIVEEESATTLLHAGQGATTDELGILTIEVA